MIEFRDTLFTNMSDADIKKAKWKIKTHRGSLNIYLLVLNHDSNKVEYFHNSMLRQRLMAKRAYDVIGLAKSEKECRDIILRIVTETMEHTGNYDFAGYLGIL